ncbi:hypothetical protein [Mesorhizobium sp.]|uniref:hypothetical protein n=1 Tax=Mesorhizobium sp. TaxID=1871066 RepID=UPI000FE5A270|nr:hypothetical protein [Mesorhizobium sp.]RWA59465.1 MAG: hypothetical protein EOQ27_26465 [Mesorhizobium sp.]
MEAMNKAGLRFNANYPQGTMTITPLRDDAPGEPFDLPIGDISKLFGTALGLATKAYDMNRSVNPSASRPIDDRAPFTAVSCSGWNVAPGATEDTLTLKFYFGEVVLGIQVPLDHARILGQRILTTAAPAGSAQ